MSRASSLNLSTALSLLLIWQAIAVPSVTSAYHCAAKQLSQKGKESWDGWIEGGRNRRPQGTLRNAKSYYFVIKCNVANLQHSFSTFLGAVTSSLAPDLDILSFPSFTQGIFFP